MIRAGAMPSPVAESGPERRRRRNEARIRAALSRLLAGPPGAGLTVAMLAREAGVGRNAIYTNHRFALDELARARRAAARPVADTRRDRMVELRSEIAALHADRCRLATENASLVKRVLEAEARAAQLTQRVERLAQQLEHARQRPAG